MYPIWSTKIKLLLSENTSANLSVSLSLALSVHLFLRSYVTNDVLFLNDQIHFIFVVHGWELCIWRSLGDRCCAEISHRKRLIAVLPPVFEVFFVYWYHTSFKKVAYKSSTSSEIILSYAINTNNIIIPLIFVIVSGVRMQKPH